MTELSRSSAARLTVPFLVNLLYNKTNKKGQNSNPVKLYLSHDLTFKEAFLRDVLFYLGYETFRL